MNFFETYKDDIMAFFNALIEFFKTIIGLISGGDAEEGAEDTSAEA